MKNGKSSRIVMILTVCMIVAVFCAGGIPACAEPSAVGQVPAVKRTAEGGLSEEAAAAGYIYRAFGMPGYVQGQGTGGKISLPAERGVTGRSRLADEKQLWLYDQLKGLASEVAAGQRGSTQFTFPVANVFYDKGYTDDELACIYDPLFDVISALVSDCPYELYWFDKTVPYGPDGGIYSYPDNGMNYLWEYDDATITLDFPVAAAYSASGAAGTYAFNTALGQAVQTAVGNAATVRDNCAAMDNLGKLTAYKDWICGHVSYNSAALGNSVLYGNPWQMVYVFDGDDDTNVVCEGYSKAFQYLCDISTFTGGVTAICVAGEMGGGTGAGGHMWNIVKMDDGRYYMADVTNSDTGTIGAGGELFLKGYTTKSGNTYTFTIHDQDVTYTYDNETLALFGGTQWLTMEGTDYEPASPLAFSRPEVDIEDQYTEGDDILISCPWVEGAESQRIYILNSSNETAYEGADFTWDTMPSGGTCEFVIDGGTLAAGNYAAWVELQGTGYETTGFSYPFEIVENVQLPEFDEPEVSIEGHYEPDEDIVISCPWVEGAESQSVTILDNDYCQVDDLTATWNAAPSGGVCELRIDGGSLADGEYFAMIELEGTGFQNTDFYYSFEITSSTLPLMTLSAPETLELGMDLLTISCADVYGYVNVEVEVRKAVEGAEFVPVRDGWYEWTQPDGAGTGVLKLNNYVFAETGTYEIGVVQKSQRNWGWKISDRAVATVTMTGYRPAPPAVVVPDGEKTAGDQIWIEVSAPGAQDVRRSIWWYSWEESEDYSAQGDTTLIPYTVQEGEQELTFQVRTDGMWSSPTAPVMIAGNHRNEMQMNILVPESSGVGKDVTVSGIPEVPGATVYTFSVGWYDEEVSEQMQMMVIDQIVYDEPFEPVNGQLVIPGCNFMTPGKYGISVTAYRDGYGDWLGEGNAVIEITADPDVQAAPAVTLLTQENLMYGMSQFRVRAAGAEKLYAFISREDDYGLFCNPVTLALDPAKSVQTVELMNRNWGNMIAYFVVSRNGVWSGASNPIRYHVDWPDDEHELGDVRITACPAEAVLGSTMTVRWNAVRNAQRYELTIRQNGMDIYSQLISGGRVTSASVNTSAVGRAGKYEVQVTAMADGYWPGYSWDEQVEVLDPARKISAELIGYGGGVAYLKISGVDAEMIRVRTDDGYTAMIPVGPGRTLSRLTLRGISEGSTIQLANYGSNPAEWGAWSSGVRAGRSQTLPSGLTTIEAGAFEGSDFETVNIPEGCEVIGEGAFRNCTNLKSVYIPDGCEIGDQAFMGCVNLEFISYPKGARMGLDVFEGCGEMIVVER